MGIDKKVFLDIVHGALFLSHYIDACKNRCQNPMENKSGLSEKWRTSFSGVNKELFLKRLEFDSINPEHLFTAMESSDFPDALPKWARTMEAICRSVGEYNYSLPMPLFIKKDDPVPFEDLIYPVVEAASQEIKKRFRDLDLPMDSKALIPMERMLLKQLSGIASEPLMDELGKGLLNGRSMLDRLMNNQETIQQNRVYKSLVKKIRGSWMLDLFKIYPVLGRLMALKKELWMEVIQEFISRLHKDLGKIIKTFKVSGKDTLIKLVEPTWSDPHHRGRTSFIITFKRGKRIIYKPRSHDLEGAYSSFIKWSRAINPDLDLHMPIMLNKKSHAWVDYIEKKEISSSNGIKSYYRRMGNLMAFIYALSGGDIHHENLIANGELPVPIDLELLCTGIPVSMSENRVKKTLTHGKIKTILDMGMLPQWQSGKGGELLSETGAIAIKEPAPPKQLIWSKITTDSMELIHKEVKKTVINSLPLKNGNYIPVKGFENDVLNGFHDAYNFLLENQSLILEKNGPCEAFKTCSSRFIFRDTRIYASIFTLALSSENLKSGINFGIALEALYRPFLHGNKKPLNWPLAESEREQLERLDIPRFTIPIQELELNCGEKSITVLANSGWEVLNFKINNLSSRDLKRQSGLLIQSLKSMSPLDKKGMVPENTQNKILEHSKYCADELVHRKITDHRQKPNWLCVFESAGGAVLREMNPSLYKGRTGPLLFLSAYAHETENKGLGEMAVKGSDLIPEKIISNLKVMGAANGIGSVIYALTKISEFTGSQKPMGTAEKLVRLITPGLIEKDVHLDVLNGSAGGILGLLAYFITSRDNMALELAVKCGDQLVKTQCRDSGGWAVSGRKPLTGFSHGAAGISLALARLYSLTNDRKYFDSALRGINYEKRVFSPSKSNWPDFRNDKKPPSYLGNWCNGAPGIGLARLGCMEIFDKKLMEEDINAALISTKISVDDPADFWCCGNFGRIEFLLSASEKLSDPDLKSQAVQLALEIGKNRAKEPFGWKMSRKQFDASAFTGISGIGYSFLRMLNPEKYPSILLWE